MLSSRLHSNWRISHSRLTSRGVGRRVGRRLLFSTSSDSDTEDSSSDDEAKEEPINLQLLRLDSVVHRWSFGNGHVKYVLAHKEVDFESIKADPAACALASLWITPDHVLHSAWAADESKVGKLERACGRLVDTAFEDRKGRKITARSTLYGLSAWVVDCLTNEDHPAAEFLSELNAPEFLIAEAFATGFIDEMFSEYRFRVWAWLAKKYAECDLGGEPTLYRLRGGRVTEVQNLTDLSERGWKESGGAIILFDFPKKSDISEPWKLYE